MTLTQLFVTESAHAITDAEASTVLVELTRQQIQAFTAELQTYAQASGAQATAPAARVEEMTARLAKLTKRLRKAGAITEETAGAMAMDLTHELTVYDTPRDACVCTGPTFNGFNCGECRSGIQPAERPYQSACEVLCDRPGICSPRTAGEEDETCGTVAAKAACCRSATNSDPCVSCCQYTLCLPFTLPA